jgi:hypothetical protein
MSRIVKKGEATDLETEVVGGLSEVEQNSESAAKAELAKL